MTKQVFAERMAFLYSYFGHILNGDRAKLYWELLKHLSDEQFSTAVQNVVKEYIPTSTNPFPLVAHFLRYCGTAGEESASQALAMLNIARGSIGAYQSVCFCDPALHWVVQAMGGWPALCTMTDKEWDVNFGRMKEIYRAAQYSNIDSVEYCPGIAESEEGWFTLYIFPTAKLNERRLIRCKGKIPEEIGFNLAKPIDRMSSISEIQILSKTITGEGYVN